MDSFLSRTRIPDVLPGGMVNVVKMLRASVDQEHCLKVAYEVLTKRYRGYRWRTYARFSQIFVFDVRALWSNPGFIHCHNVNYLTRVLLVKSGFFDEQDIEARWTLVWYISPHQYLSIRMHDGRYVDIDIWGAAQNIPYGSYAHGFC